MALHDPKPQRQTQAEIIDISDKAWHLRVRQGMPFQVRWNVEGHPSHYFATRAAAEAAMGKGLGL